MKRSLVAIEEKANEVLAHEKKVEDFKMKIMEFILHWYGEVSKKDQYECWKHSIELNYGYEFQCECIFNKYIYTDEERKERKELCKRNTFNETYEKYCNEVGV